MTTQIKFSIAHLPYTKRGIPGRLKDIEMIKGFRVKPMGELEKVLVDGRLPFKHSIEKAAKALNSTLDQLQQVGFDINGLNLQVFKQSISAGKFLDISIRGREQLTQDSYISAVVGRACDPKVVLRDFDIKDALSREDISDVDKILLSAKYIKFRIGKDIPVGDQSALLNGIVEISGAFVPKIQFKDPQADCEKWCFLNALSTSLNGTYSISNSGSLTASPQGTLKIEISTEDAIRLLIATTAANYTVQNALSWLSAHSKK